ncbi:MAG: translation initiation factor eIF-2B [Halobacteriales archaeon]
MIDETVEEIRELQTHSSSAVAVKAARALGALLNREYATVEEYERALKRNSDALRRASPSHASLWTTQQTIIDAIDDEAIETVAAAKERTQAAIDRVIERVETAKTEAAATAATTITDGDTILTHDYSTTVLAAIGRALDDGDVTGLSIHVTEARPRYLGRKMVRELAERSNVEATLLVDSAAGYQLENADIDRVMVGMDCIVDDRLYNRIGTYPIAAAAADIGVPMEVVGSSAKLVEGGFRFENEFRPISEVMREPAEGFSITNPAYDATPTDLLDHVYTDTGTIEY